jgi:hypothetical protein
MIKDIMCSHCKSHWGVEEEIIKERIKIFKKFLCFNCVFKPKKNLFWDGVKK